MLGRMYKAYLKGEAPPALGALAQKITSCRSGAANQTQ
jgi:hypothetical protein